MPAETEEGKVLVMTADRHEEQVSQRQPSRAGFGTARSRISDARRPRAFVSCLVSGHGEPFRKLRRRRLLTHRSIQCRSEI